MSLNKKIILSIIIFLVLALAIFFITKIYLTKNTEVFIIEKPTTITISNAPEWLKLIQRNNASTAPIKFDNEQGEITNILLFEFEKIEEIILNNTKKTSKNYQNARNLLTLIKNKIDELKLGPPIIKIDETINDVLIWNKLILPLNNANIEFNIFEEVKKTLEAEDNHPSQQIGLANLQKFNNFCNAFFDKIETKSTAKIVKEYQNIINYIYYRCFITSQTLNIVLLEDFVFIIFFIENMFPILFNSDESLEELLINLKTLLQ